MKKYIIFLFILSAAATFAQEKIVKSKIKVFGNCGTCKQRIETALEVKGIKTASWNSTSKELDIVYNKSKIAEQRIHELIAAIGHDTELVKAKDVVYSELPFCCLYRDHDYSNIVDEKPHKNH